MARASNKNLKRANAETEYTAENIEELKKCASDPVYFIKNYVKIQHPTQGAIPFDLYPYQIDMLNAYHTERYTVVLSARQTGKCFTLDTNVGVIVPLGNNPINIIKKVILKLLDRKKYDELYKGV